jgi:hypothetical protein
MSGHTPGPWRPDPELTPRDPGASALQCRFFYGPDGLAIFRMGLGYENTATNEANARLISAAPAMLEALKAAENHFGGPFISLMESDPDPAILRTIRAAISQATGAGTQPPPRRPDMDSQALIQRLEAAEVGSRELDAEIGLLIRHDYPHTSAEIIGEGVIRDRAGEYAAKPYTTSLDAALALVERHGLDPWQVLYAAMMNWKAHDPRGSLSRELPLAICIALLRSQQGQAQ